MNLNPEFQRQLYLECSQARLIGIPLTLATIFALSYLIDGHQLGNLTAKAALTLFMFITPLWGARQAMTSITEEYRDRTWDTQRLSALGAWDMTWGKLLGSTIMTWYGGIICLSVYALATEEAAALPWLLFYCFGSALLLQGGSLLLGLLAVQREQNKSDSIFLITVVAFFSMMPWLMNTSESDYYHMPSAISWYGLLIDDFRMYQLSLLSALFWCIVGSYRLTAQALGMRTLPWVWLGFVAFLIIYLGGFIPGSTYSFSLAVLAVCVALTYVGVVVERNDAMRIKRLFTYFSEGNWRRAGEEMPIWWLSLALTIPAALWLSFGNQTLHGFSAVFHFYPLAIVLILLRDCAIYLYYFYGKNPQRAFSTTLLAALFLYGILPGLFSAIGLSLLSTLSFPLWAETNAGAVLCSLLQTGLILSLLYRRWKSNIQGSLATH